MQQTPKLQDGNLITKSLRKSYKPMFLAYLRYLPLILLSILFAPKISYAFGVGIVDGLNCTTSLFNPKPVPCSIAELDKQNSYEEVHQHITNEALKNLKYKNARIKDEVLALIEKANADSDWNQENTAIHCDNENTYFCALRVSKYYKYISVYLERQSTITKEEAQHIRYLFGHTLHTIQDFYSHTNWVNTHPDPKDIQRFWKDGLMSLELTQRSERACVNTPDLLWNAPLGTGLLTEETSDKGGLLTSGYAWTPLLAAYAPWSKCAHGLAGTGIHKDWTSRELHTEARDRAVHATYEFAQDLLIRNEKNYPDNVCMFLTNAPCTIVSVKKSGSGGRVYSVPGGIFCTDSIDSECSAAFNADDKVDLFASANGSSTTFKSWSGDCASASVEPDGSFGRCTINMDGNEKNVVANFDGGDCSYPKIGDKCHGGIVFYVDGTGQHGLVIAEQDQGKLPWDPRPYPWPYLGATADGVGAGASNTTLIINSIGPGGYAAMAARSYNGGGYNDWYLPSLYELNLLRNQAFVVGGFVDDDYWSSLEYGNWSSLEGIFNPNAWGQYIEGQFNYFGGDSAPFKSATYRVRAVRAF